MTPTKARGEVVGRVRREQCGTCRFYMDHGGTYADCVRRAPVRLADRERGSFPWMTRTDWCGEFERREPTRWEIENADPA